MVMNAEHRSNLQPFTGNGDISIWVNKFSKKTKQTKIMSYVKFLLVNVMRKFSPSYVQTFGFLNCQKCIQYEIIFNQMGQRLNCEEPKSLVIQNILKQVT